MPAVACAAFLVTAAAAYAQPFNHEQCYKIKDAVKLDGIVDMDAPQYAKFFCVPAEKTFVSATDKATGLPIVPLPFASASQSDLPYSLHPWSPGTREPARHPPGFDLPVRPRPA